ncbi:MAG: UDP-N-acetylmuramoyl-L-alanine--D-glutamate ligase [Candidatus Moranbacteria bacterium]|nr:UDP-N-acetylmuramoyl-L-alanine--D-glutamate ligase [Candidatus Moranbacteria bacterium]
MQGQSNSESRARARRTLQCYISTQQSGVLTGDAQAETGPAVLSSGFRTMSAGNIGISPAELINDKNIQFLVYELSSYQLHYLKNIRFDFGALLNVTEDHLAWHGNMKNYFDDKMRLSTISDNFAYNADSVCLEKDFDFLKIGKNKMEKCACHIDLGNKEYMINLRGDLKRIDYSGLKLLGEHNIYNAAFASLIGVYYGITEGAIEKSLEEFLPEEHRMEIFENYKDVEFVNDSKSTNADSLVNAIKTFHKKHNNLILLCGGRGKGEDYTILSQEIIGKVKKTYICGENSRELRTLLEGKCDFENFENWNSLIDSVFDNLEKNTTVLFSPGGSSFDFFENYKQRGEYFKKYVNSKLISLNL